MEIQEFVANFANQFDDTEIEIFNSETRFRDLEEWSSLIGLAVLNMIAKKYEVKVTPAELKSVETIEALYNLVASKK